MTVAIGVLFSAATGDSAGLECDSIRSFDLGHSERRAMRMLQRSPWITLKLGIPPRKALRSNCEGHSVHYCSDPPSAKGERHRWSLPEGQSSIEKDAGRELFSNSRPVRIKL